MNCSLSSNFHSSKFATSLQLSNKLLRIQFQNFFQVRMNKCNSFSSWFPFHFHICRFYFIYLVISLSTLLHICSITDCCRRAEFRFPRRFIFPRRIMFPILFYVHFCLNSCFPKPSIFFLIHMLTWSWNQQKICKDDKVSHKISSDQRFKVEQFPSLPKVKFRVPRFRFLLFHFFRCFEGRMYEIICKIKVRAIERGHGKPWRKRIRLKRRSKKNKRL